MTLLTRRIVPMLAALVVIIALGPSQAFGKEATRLRILLVIDTDAKGAEVFGAALDRDNVRATLLRNLKQQNLHYTLDVLQGANATPQRVLSYYEKLKTGPDESLLFYYTGHGAMARDQGQVLTMRHGRLPRSKLREAMLKSSPRLTVILTDCCSSGMSENEAAPSEGPAPQKAAPGKPARSGSVFRDLFFRHQGLVVLSAAKVGQNAIGTRKSGSHFTVALTQLLNAPPARFDYNKDGFVEWREFFPTLRQETQRLAKTKHTPQAFFLGQVGN